MKRNKQIITLKESEQVFADLIIANLDPNNKNKLYKYECYLKAFPHVKSVASAKALSSELLKRPRIQEYIQKRKQAAARKIEVTIQDVLRGLLRIANFDPRKLYNEKGKLKKVIEWDDDIALAINGIRFGYKKLKAGKDKEILKTYIESWTHESRKEAWNLIGQHLNMFDKNAISETAEEFVSSVRGFAESVSNAVPGGRI